MESKKHWRERRVEESEGFVAGRIVETCISEQFLTYGSSSAIIYRTHNKVIKQVIAVGRFFS